MNFALANLDCDGAAVPSLFVGGHYFPIEQVMPGFISDNRLGLLELFERWSDAESRLLDVVAGDVSKHAEPIVVAGPLRFLAPITYPSKVICTGVNYFDHIRLDGGILDFKKEAQDIVFFMKHSRALVGSGQAIRYPSHSAQFDWEVELTAVFGKRARRVAEKDAQSCIAAYSVGLDLSLRDWQRNSRHFRQFDLFCGKVFDDCAPMGPHLVPARFVDPANLKLQLSVNGKLRQDSDTRQMIWSLAEQVAELSQNLTLEPGDVLFTGTPAGCGVATGDFLRPGDHVEAMIDGLGTLSIEVGEDPDARAARVPPVSARKPGGGRPGAPE